ncbi:MAG: TfpX/TfpZ family type IV pilin accessory protein [Burkholderiaceae bacterium]
MQRSALTCRLRAAGIHFLISALVVGVVLTLASWLWYPDWFFYASGLLGMATVLAIVDLVIGPLLTLVVYKPGKPSLRFDLSVIAAIQLAALVYGVSSMYWARPVYVALVVDRFEVVAAADLEESSLAEAPEPYRDLPATRAPGWVTVNLPTDPRELEAIMMAETLNGTGPALMPKYYSGFERVPPAAMQRTRALDELARFNDPALVEKSLQALGEARDGLRYLPLSGVGRDMTVLVRAADGTVVKTLNLRPWS